MSANSPASTLYSSDGIEISVQNAVAIPANTRAILLAGSDGTDSRYLSMDTSGRPVMVGAGTAGTSVGGVLSIQGVTGGTPMPISGSITATNPSVGTVGSAPPTSATLIGGSNGSDLFALSVDASGHPIVIGNSTPTDAFANPTGALLDQSFLMGWNTSSWDRLESGGDNTDAESTISLGVLKTGSHLMGFNGTSWDRLRSANTGTLSVGFSDIYPSTGTITAQDTATTSTTVAYTQVFLTGTPTANSAVTFTTSSWASGQILVTGTWTGTLQVEVSIDGGTTYVRRRLHLDGLDVPETTFTQNFVGVLGLEGVTNVRVRSTAAWTGTATVKIVETNNPSVTYNFAGSRIYDSSGNGSVAVKPSSTSAAAADPSLVVALSPNSYDNACLTSPNARLAGLFAYPSAWGTMRVSAEPIATFIEQFNGSSLDPNNWSTPSVAGGGSITVANGVGTYATGTTGGAYVITKSVPTFYEEGLGFIIFGSVIKIEAVAVTGTYRFAGIGTTPGSPSVTAPLTDAVGFEQDTSGNLNACIWASGTKIYSQALTRPSDGGYHRYIVAIRPDTVVWYFDSYEVPVASVAFTTPSQCLLPITLALYNPASAPGSAPTFAAQAIAMGDSTNSSLQISDGVYPWRQATIKQASTAAVASDTALVVAISPNNIVVNKEQRPSTATQTSVSVIATSTTILAANANRLSATLMNDGTQNLYLLFGSGTATSTAYTVLIPSGGYYELPFPCYTGQLTGIWAGGGSGAVRVTEMTP